MEEARLSKRKHSLTLKLETEAVQAKEDVEYIECEELAQLMGEDAQREKLVLLDVRQADFVGGHITGAEHIPFGHTEASVGDLSAAHGRGKTIVVNCMYSQQRGPSAAATLLRRIRADADGEGGDSKVVVLRGGFHRWLNRWISDEEEAAALIEGYDPRMWRHESERMQLVHIADHPETALDLAIQRLSAPAALNSSNSGTF